MTKSVFISSTSKDLMEYRSAVDKAIRRLELRPINMDDFGSQPGGASGVSVRQVSKADIFLGIVARRYGYVPEGMEKSVTEQEYDEAVRLKLPRLMYLLDTAHDWLPERVEADETAQTRLAAFRARIEKNEVRSLFTTPDSLAAQVTADLTRLMDKQQRQQILTRLMVVIAAIVVIVAAIVIGSADTRTALMVELGAITRTYTPSPTLTPSNTPTPTATFTPTNTPTSTNTPTMMPTALEGVKYTEDQVGVILADFKYIDPNLDKVEDNLEREFTDAGIPFIRVKHELTNRQEAQAISDLYNATIVMWGEVAKGGIQLNFEVTPRRSEIGYSLDSLQVTVTQLTNFDAYIFAGMDNLYVVDFVLGQLHFHEGKYTAALDAYNQAIGRIPAGREKDVKADIVYYLRANVFGTLGQFQKAIADLNKVIEINPSLPDAYLERGLVTSILGNKQQAVDDLEKVISLQPDSYELFYAHVSLAKVYILSGQYDLAKTEYDTAISVEPDRATGYASRGIDLLGAGVSDYKTAIDDLNRAIELDAENADYYVYRGGAYQSLGDSEAAQKDFQQALQLYNQRITAQPNDGALYIQRSSLYTAMGNVGEALNDLSQAIKLQPDFSDAYRRRAVVYTTMGDYPHALEDATTTIQLDPTDPIGYTNRVNVYLLSGNLEAAITDITSAIQLAPDLSLLYSLRSSIYILQDKYDDALTDINRAIELSPQEALHYLSRAEISYEHLNDPAGALADYTHAIELKPNYALVYDERGKFFQYEQDYRKAVEDFNRAIVLSPGNADYYRSRGKVQLQLDDAEAAFQDFDRAVQIDPQNADTYAFRGVAYSILSHDDQALKDFSQAIALKPDDAFPYFARGTVYSKLGESGKAIDDFSQYIRLQPDDADGYLNRAFEYSQTGKTPEAMADYWQFVNHHQTQGTPLDHFEQGKPTSLEMHSGWVYAIPFNGLAGQYISATAASVEKGAVDPVLILLNANDDPVVFNDDLSGDNFDSAITGYVLPTDGTYTLIVSHAGGGSEGKIDVSLVVGQKVESTPEATVEAIISP